MTNHERSNGGARSTWRRAIVGVTAWLCAWTAISIEAAEHGNSPDIQVRLTLKTDNRPIGGTDFFRLAFSPNGKILAFTDGNDGVTLWDLAKNTERLSLINRQPRRVSPIYCFAFSPDSETFATGGFDGVIRLVDVTSGKLKSTLDTFRSKWILAFSPDGRRLLSVPDGPTPGDLWDPKSGKHCGKTQIYATHCYTVAFAPDGGIIAVGSRGANVYLYRADTGEQIATLKTDGDMGMTVAFTPDGETLVAGGGNGDLRFWDVKTRKRKATFERHNRDYLTPIDDLAFSPDGKTLAVVERRSGAIRLWDVTTRRVRASFEGTKKNAGPLAFSPDGRTLAAGCHDGSIQLWDLAAVKAAAPDAAEIRRLWALLAGDAAPAAYKAIRILSAFPTETLPFLRRQLEPSPTAAAMKSKIENWIADLDSSSYPVRQTASDKLEKCGAIAESALRRVLKERPSLEVHKRASGILGAIERQKDYPLPEQLRQLRAVEVLEHIGTVEARKLLEDLAKGAPEARLTREAKASLARLAKRPTPKP